MRQSEDRRRGACLVMLLAGTTLVSFSCLDARSGWGQRQDASTAGGDAEPAPPTVVPSPEAAARRTLLIDEELSRPVWAEASRLGAQRVILVTEHYIDPDHDGVADPAKFRKRVLDIAPQFDGYVVIDWETPIFDWLRQGPGVARFDQAVGGLRSLLELGRQLRPNAKWGVYGLPLREYWKRDEAWRGRGRALRPLLDATDALFPSVYDFYRDGEDVEPVHDRRYVRENVALALEAADGKPVYAYVMPRYHNSNRKAGQARIPAEELIRHVRAVFEAEHDGRRAAGIVWWDREAWKTRQGRFKDEMRPGESTRAFVDRHHRETLAVLSEALWGDGPS